MYILFIGTSRLLRHQGVVSPPIGHRRIQIVAIDIAGKGPGLAHQPTDDVAVVDPMLILAAQARHPLDQLLGIPDLDLLQADADLDLDADQPRRHRVGMVFHLDGTAATDAHAFSFQRLQTPFRQRPQVRHLLGDFRRPARITLLEHAQDQLPVVSAAGKVPAAT
jgi:hypothetical protein